MIGVVLTFAFLTALFEAALLAKMVSIETLRKSWFQNAVHILAVSLNLAIHFGTVVGTMTAVTAGLVSFITVPAVLFAKCMYRRYHA